jgi:hypothetical protein
LALRAADCRAFFRSPRSARRGGGFPVGASSNGESLEFKSVHAMRNIKLPGLSIEFAVSNIDFGGASIEWVGRNIDVLEFKLDFAACNIKGLICLLGCGFLLPSRLTPLQGCALRVFGLFL